MFSRATPPHSGNADSQPQKTSVGGDLRGHWLAIWAAVLFAVTLSIAASGCLIERPPPEPCNADSDCNARYLCARDGQCLPPTELLSVRLSWTINNQPVSVATPDICTNVGIDVLDAVFETRDRTDSISYFPVTCELGFIHIDRIPAIMSDFSFIALDSMSSVVDQKTSVLSPGVNEIVFDFSL